MAFPVSPISSHSYVTVVNSTINPNILKNQVIFFAGYAGSGKGTQGKILAAEWNITHLSTGELFRAEANKRTEIGLQMAEYMNRGEVIPKEIVFSYLRQELSDPKYRQGFILDGYPKAIEFYEHFMPLLKELDLEPLAAIHFDISREMAIQRLTGRLHCDGCNKDFHVVFLPPKKDGTCDDCNHSLESRFDDTVDAIEKRLNVFDFTTRPVIKKFEEAGLLFTVNAAKPLSQVKAEITTIVTQVGLRRIQETTSYYLREPRGPEKSSVFHNHIDAESFEVLHTIIRRIESVSLDFQNKIYPVSHLQLGPQLADPEFTTVYKNLPNFHKIQGNFEEAFSTGKMGDDGFNYEQIRATLEAAFASPKSGVMTELEEEIFSQEFDAEGNRSITLDRGFTPIIIDWDQLPVWRTTMIANIPRFELHHAFDIKKGEDKITPPVDLATLSAKSTEIGLETGGWFIFRKKNEWSYRSNQFSNRGYEENRGLLIDQAVRLRALVGDILPNQPFTSSCSLEKVHAIWRV